MDRYFGAFTLVSTGQPVYFAYNALGYAVIQPNWVQSTGETNGTVIGFANGGPTVIVKEDYSVVLETAAGLFGLGGPIAE